MRAMRGLVLGVATGCLQAAPAWTQSQINIVPDPARTISVTGRGSVSVVPDTATTTLGVAVRDLDLAKAKSGVDGVLQKLLALAKQLQVAEADLRTSSINIDPEYDFQEHSVRQFVGYSVSRSVTITLRDLQKLEQLLDGAIQAGANRDFDVSLSSSREAELKQEAVAKAIADAKRQAEFAAEKLGLRLGAVRNASLNKVSGTELSSVTSNYTRAAPDARFLPGTITVNAEAFVSYLLEEGTAQRK